MMNAISNDPIRRAPVARPLAGALSRGLRALALVAAALLPVAAVADVPVLKVATGQSPKSPVQTDIYDPWLKALEEAGGGDFKLQVFGPTFANATNTWERTVNGVADIGVVLLSNAGRPFPKAGITTLPLLAKDMEAAAIAMQRMIDQGIIADEFADVKVLGISPVPATGMLGREPITSMDQLKGMKVRSLDKNSADSLVAMGAAPIAVPFSEAYQALNRGVVSAAMANAYSITAFRLGEVAKHFTPTVPLGMANGLIFMNKQAYEKLSPKAREGIDRFAKESGSRMLGALHMQLEKKIFDNMREKGEIQFHALSDAEKARWEATLKPVIQGWIAATPDGQRVHDAFVKEYADALKAK